MVSISRPREGELRHLVVRRGDARATAARAGQGSGGARAGCGTRGPSCSGSRRWRRPRGSRLQFFSTSALPSRDPPLALGEPRGRHSQSLQALPGADQRRIEQQRRLEIGDRLLLAALRLVDVAPVVVGQRVDRVERDGGGVVVDRARQVAGPAIGEAATVERARAVGIEPDRLREVGDRGLRVAFHEVRMAAADEESRCRGVRRRASL